MWSETPAVFPAATGRRSLTAEAIGRLAVRAAVHEAAVTPKPGLVCPDSQGAHQDMDFTTMVVGALSLEPFFTAAATLGMDSASHAPAEVFTVLRRLGQEAETAMLAATGGVNTHKGLVFSLGILTAATGRHLALGPEQGLDCAAICRTGATLVQGIIRRDFGRFLPLREADLAGETRLEQAGLLAGRRLTAGERYYLLHGVTGIRGEAEQGFPHVRAARAAFARWLPRHGFNTAAVNVLLLLLTSMEDTTILHRGGLPGQALARECAGAALHAGGAGTPEGLALLRRMQGRFCAHRLSPGGCADLLAVTLYFHLLETYLSS